jgi:UDP-N-acetylmuramoyl-L-alanyl-D-glutamate--2,6-diaminopimelate ligase
MPKKISGLNFSGISDDSRTTNKGDIFFAVEGTQHDGNGFIKEAIKKGATAVVAGKNCDPRGIDRGLIRKIVRVPNPRKALSEFAADFYDRPSKKVKVIGITGTNGKTTIAYLLEQIFKMAGYDIGIVGTIAHRWKDKIIEAKNTTPGSLELQRLLSRMAKEDVDYCAMEVSSHSLDQDRVCDVDFKIAVFTNITGEHMDYHKTFKNYLNAKIKLFKNLKSNALAVLNADDPNFNAIKKSIKGKILTYGIKNKANIMAELIRSSLNKTEFLVTTKDGLFKIASPLIGIFNVYNILAAIGVALSEGLRVDTIKEAVLRFKGAEGRLESVSTNRGFKVFIDYAHTDNALENVLGALRPLTQNRLISVFGCGGDRDRFKRPRMGKAASRLSDYVIITSDNPRSEKPQAIAREIEKGIEGNFKSYEVVLDRYEAIKKALEIAKPGDVVLIAGKGHEKYQIIKDRISPFCDKKVAREIILKNNIGLVDIPTSKEKCLI